MAPAVAVPLIVVVVLVVTGAIGFLLDHSG
jgi:hypothetical protein